MWGWSGGSLSAGTVAVHACENGDRVRDREKSSGSFLSNHITVSDEGMKADQGVSFHETKIYLI